MKHALAALLLAASAAAAAAEGDDRSAEIQSILTALRGPDQAERTRACRSLGYSGLTDPVLFDFIEQKVLADFAEVPQDGSPRDRELEQEISWCVKALAFSGNARYRPTLERLSESLGRIRDHALTALEWLPDFEHWNRAINSPANHKPGQAWAVTRALNMLKSSDVVLQKEGLKAIKELNGPDPAPLYDEVERQLLEEFADCCARDDAKREDLLAWYAKALGESGRPKYRPTLVRVANEARTPKMRRHADKALTALDAGG
jgi:hypothetical protein